MLGQHIQYYLHLTTTSFAEALDLPKMLRMAEILVLLEIV
jgi:hypothetical protein